MSATRRIARLAAWLVGLAPLEETRPVLALSWGGAIAAACFGAFVFFRVTSALWATPRPAPVPPDDPATSARFGLTASDRREIFRELAAAEPGERASAERRFAGQAWSIDDDRASGEREAVLGVAARRKLNVTVVYLVLDEGIRNKWPGPDGKPLAAAVAPLNPRAQ